MFSEEDLVRMQLLEQYDEVEARYQAEVDALLAAEAVELAAYDPDESLPEFYD